MTPSFPESRWGAGALIVLAIAIAIGAGVAVADALRDPSTQAGRTSVSEPTLTLTRAGTQVRACFGQEQCVTTSAAATDVSARLDPAAEATSSYLLVLTPAGTSLELGPDAVTKSVGGFLATALTLDGTPACVAFSVTLPRATTASDVSVDLTQTSGAIREGTSEQGCRAL